MSGVTLLTISRSDSDISPTEFGELNARWAVLIKGIIICLEMTSAEILGPAELVSHLNMKSSRRNSKAKSCNWYRWTSVKAPEGLEWWIADQLTE